MTNYKDSEGHYSEERKGYETKDGGLIRINGNDKVRIDIYDGDEREKGGHTRDTINYDTNTGRGTIDSHNEDKSDKTRTDIICYLTSACIQYFQESFDDNCYELTILRWFRDNFVSKEDITHYYKIAPIIVESINKEKKLNIIYDYIYENVVDYCVEQIENGNYIEAYNRYKNSVLALEEKFARNALETRLVKVLRTRL